MLGGEGGGRVGVGGGGEWRGGGVKRVYHKFSLLASVLTDVHEHHTKYHTYFPYSDADLFSAIVFNFLYFVDVLSG